LSPLSQKETYHAGTAGGASNAYTITISPPGGLTAAVLGDLTGKRISFIIPAAAANTGATLLTVTLGTTTLTAKPILKNGSVGLANGDLAVGQLVEVVYDGSNFQMTSHVGVLNAVELAGHAKEIYIKRASATTISLGTSGIAGSIANFDVVLKNINNPGQYVTVNTAGFTINSATTGLNGMDVGTLGASSGWYYIWIASNGATTGGVLSTSNTTLDSSITTTYPYTGLVGAVYATAGSLTPFTAIGRKHFVQNVLIGTFINIVPPIAKTWWGTMSNSNAGGPAQSGTIAADANGLGQQQVQSCVINIGSGATAGSSNFLLPLSVYSYTTTGTVSTINVAGFEI
jgi:hypothetical protein